MIRKVIFPVLLLFLCAFFISCAQINYGKSESWVIRQNDLLSKKASFDVFYVYPTLFADKKQPLMNFRDPNLAAKTHGFAEAQTSIFGSQVRIFAPFVRQLEYGRCGDFLRNPSSDYSKTEMEQGIADTVDALQYYLKHYNEGRPYILVGHSQGAVDLYEAMKRCPEITPESGFVAAYLIGMPRITPLEIRLDFSIRGIFPAQNADDTGVIIVWNTQNATAKNPLFTIPRGYVINPLNWRTDNTPAPANLNEGAIFYHYKKANPSLRYKTVPHFCGARIDTQKGALIVDLPANGKYDANAFMGAGVFHMNDIWFFAKNLASNAHHRVKNAKLRMPPERSESDR